MLYGVDVELRQKPLMSLAPAADDKCVTTAWCPAIASPS